MWKVHIQVLCEHDAGVVYRPGQYVYELLDIDQDWEYLAADTRHGRLYGPEMDGLAIRDG